jgi:hypothetical protein
LIEPANLGQTPALVLAVAGVAWLVEVLDAVEQEPQREPALVDRLVLVLLDSSDFLILSTAEPFDATSSCPRAQAFGRIPR